MLYRKKVVVPLNLRSRVLNKLHPAHQGVTSIHSYAQYIMLWSCSTQEIESIQ